MIENVTVSLVHFFISLVLIEHLLHAQQCGDCLLEKGSRGYSVAEKEEGVVKEPCEVPSDGSVLR